MSRMCITCLLMLLLLNCVQDGMSAETQDASSLRSLELPPLWQTTVRTNEGWQVSGRCSGNARLALEEAALKLNTAGWEMDKVVHVKSEAEDRVMLVTWSHRDGKQLLMSLADDGPGQCRFSIGEIGQRNRGEETER